ncbi:hypothetical protein [Sphingomonas echinoides]|uniref:Uncharacterized protein n=1 Tax=Sphingomonas echinoides TaxID=59803 RepID=A0ABU4PNB5_9SPHN|nr:hypothetical protein [Sphingomonas echinoides]MDX5984924.1 hypothetical protein [Sphingomonas echinoides]
MSAVLMIGGSAAAQAVDDPLTRPIATDYAARWLAPQPPKRIYGNTYLVGFRKMNVALIDTIRLGKVGVIAVATPGHTAGSTSWRWRSCEAGRCLNMVFASSINPVSVDGYRFSDPAHRAIVATFRHTIARVGALPCDILFTAHPDNSGGDVTFARFEQYPTPNPFIDPAACRKLSVSYTGIVDARLAKEAQPAVVQ